MSAEKPDDMIRSFEQSEKEKSLLLSLTTAITACQQKEDIQQIVTEKLSGFFNLNEIMICLDNDDQITHSNYIHTISQQTMQHPDFARGAALKYYIKDGIYEVIQQADKVVFFRMEDLMKRPDRPYYVDFFFENDVTDLIGFPIRTNKTSFGAVYVYVKDQRTFTDSEILLAHAVCASISVAIANVKALEKIKSQLSEIETYKNLLEAQKQYLVDEISASYNFDEIIGSNRGLKATMHLVKKVAPTPATVILLGETGTGKELIARAIHQASPRKSKLMIKINCAAIPANLIESELFGHVKGSFTGASDKRVGKFELASGSTLFLDEIGEMPLEAQAKLLRVLQDGEFERIGSNTVIKTDVRIIAATNRDLYKDAQQGKFRLDLFHRLYSFPISIPPLRDRKEDIPELVYFFIAKHRRLTGRHIAGVTDAVLNDLNEYCWPGNIRELENLMERSILLAESNLITAVTFPEAIDQNPLVNDTSHFSHKSLEDMNRHWILSILKQCNGKIHGEDGAAKRLNLPPTTLQAKLKKLGIVKGYQY